MDSTWICKGVLIFYLNHCLWDVDECTGVLPHDTRLECLFLLFLSLFFMVGHVFPSLFSSLFCTIFWGWGASLALTKISNSLYFRFQASHQMCAERKECIPKRKWQLLVDIYVYFFFFQSPIKEGRKGNFKKTNNCQI